MICLFESLECLLGVEESDEIQDMRRSEESGEVLPSVHGVVTITDGR